ncbi:MAG: pilus assembly PilX N-terminal domain-containing protein [Gammaproteobacteria bacterium]|jgi:Tfp pilus assembly protein PilX
MQTYSKSDGSALLVALIFTVILTALVISSMQTSLLQNKMATAFLEQNSVLAEAEARIYAVEQSIAKTGRLPREVDLEYSSSDCPGVNFFRITVAKQLGTAEALLHSFFVTNADVSKCPPNSIVAPGRQAWRIFDSEEI